MPRYWTCRMPMPQKKHGLCLEPTVDGWGCRDHAGMKNKIKPPELKPLVAATPATEVPRPARRIWP